MNHSKEKTLSSASLSSRIVLVLVLVLVLKRLMSIMFIKKVVFQIPQEANTMDS